jgi:hypothetical protein
MKKIIRLTESDLVRIVKQVIKEQPFGGLLNMPETGYSAIDIQPLGECVDTATEAEMILEMFGGLRGLKGQPSTSDKTIQSWVKRLYNSMSGVGVSSDLTKVLTEIKTPQQMGAVLNAYNQKYGRTLYKDLSGEYGITWKTIWNIVKKFEKSVTVTYCKKVRNQNLSA